MRTIPSTLMVAFLMLALTSSALGFAPRLPQPTTSITRRFLAGFAVDTKPKGMGNRKKTTKAKAPVFDVSASVLRHSDRYDELLQTAAKSMAEDRDDDDDDQSTSVFTSTDSSFSTTEYIVTARDKTQTIVPDWVPIGHLIVSSTLDTTEADEVALKQACVSLYCRELSHLASSGSRLWSQLPRNNFEYALETIDSFQKHVYERVLDNGKNQVEQLTVDQAKEMLNIDSTTAVDNMDLATIKRQYRKLSFEHHPDRHDTPETKEAAVEQYAKIQSAFDRLTQSGMIRKSGSSWYESLGGKARTDFSVVSLLSLEEAQRVVESSRIHRGSAVSGMEPDIVQTFLARSNSASARS